MYFRGWSNFGNLTWINFRGPQNLYLKKQFFCYFCLNKQKKLKDLNIKINMLVTLTGSLFLLTIYYHFFHHLNVQKCCQHHPPIQVRYLLYISVSNIVAHPKSKVLPSYVIIFIKFLFSTRESISLNGCKRLQFLKNSHILAGIHFIFLKKTS